MVTPGVTASPRSAAGIRFPKGGSLPVESWERRHRGILILLGLHAIGLPVFGFYMRAEPAHALFEGGVVAALGLLAWQPWLDRRIRSVVASFGLMSSSAVLTHLSGGYIEAHFHFFVMLGVIFLYEDWLPYVLAVAYVAVHHGIAGTLDPLSVYNHPSAIAHPWQWAGIHAVFIAGLSVALIVAWNVIQSARLSETRALSQAQELKRQLHVQEKMAALGSLVSGLAHEVRTPLTVIGTSAELLELAARREPHNALAERLHEHTADIRASVDRINGLVLQLRRFHSLEADEMQNVPLDVVVREAMRLFSSVNKHARTIRVELDATPPARLHLLGVHQIVLNLVGNAVEATDPATGIVVVRTLRRGDRAVLVVQDNGVGMAEETRRQAFDPLFTTKKEGMGLGLHIVKRIVDAHGGEIRCDSSPGTGTTFEVLFPLDAPDPPAVTAEQSARPRPAMRSAS